ncbi:hypothetical protein LUZ61_001260 [Rhynchospora tenuis]|uniref:TF-B3 domain-containing protein n=1 Tax=Rhynchospora tenuis TaxID=198213 RepID=A0AAD6EQT7_9POAL|nr:hypothetical protein LUZ61_001260 [Rhynchospora tenuis]
MKQMKHPKASSSTPKTNPHFFKFLFPDALADLRIPKKFYKHLPTVLPKWASLVTQSCKIWRVDVHQNEEGIYFSRGWSEFVKAHDLQLGYFLLFRYEGKMIFTVKVFDTTCCLKDYALTPCEPKQPIFQSSKVVDLTFDVRSEVYSCDAQIPVDSGKKRKHASGKAQLVCEEDGEEGEPKKEKIQKSTPTAPQFEKTKKNSPTVPQFEKTLSPSSTTKDRKSLAIPKRFCVENGLVSKQAIFLMNSKGNKWRVKILIRQYHADLTTGWRDFSKENELKKGDICIFQLINRNTFLVNVMPHVKSWTSEKKQIARDRKNSYTLGLEKSTKRIISNTDPVTECERTIANYNSQYMSFPKTFCQKNGLTSNRTMKLKDSENHEWTLNFYYNSLDGRLVSGWSNFINENGLKKGDKLKFKVMAHGTMLFGRARGQGTSRKSWMGGKQQTTRNKKNSHTLVSEKRTKRISGNTDPITECERTIANYNSKYMNFPGTFCRKNGLTSNRTMKLKDSENHEWTLKFYYNNLDGRLVSGWSNFITDNGLKKGDKVKFKVVAHDTMFFCHARGQGTSRKSDA